MGRLLSGLFGELFEELKEIWLMMLEPPWGDDGHEYRSTHWLYWLIGWAWSLAGLVLGAVVAPFVVQFARLTATPFQDALVIGVAMIGGFLVQLLGWGWMAFGRLIFESVDWTANLPKWLEGVVMVVAVPFVVLPPLGCVTYSIYRYLTWVGPNQQTVTIAFVGGLLIKTFAIPLIKAIITGALFRWFMRWLRGGKDTNKAA